MKVWSRIRSTWAGSPAAPAEPPAVPALAEVPPTPPEPLSVDPGAVQEPISHVAITAKHFLADDSANVACGAEWTPALWWTSETADVTCVACLDATAPTREPLDVPDQDRSDYPSLGERPHNPEHCDQNGQPHLGPCTDPAPEPAPVIRKVHFAKDGTSACSVRPASPDHITEDVRLVTCKRCDRTLW